MGAMASRTAANVGSGNRGIDEYGSRGSGNSGESGSQSPETACQPSSRMNVDTPSRRASGATSRTVAMSMSSLAPVEIRFESVPLELKVASFS